MRDNTGTQAKASADERRPSIRIRYSYTVPEDHPPMFAYALKAEVVASRLISDHIFVFHRSKTNDIGDCTDEFIQIASPLEMEEVPEDAPELQDNMPYYRSKEVTLWFRNKEDLIKAEDKIKDDVRTLIYTYEILDNGFDASKEETYE